MLKFLDMMGGVHVDLNANKINYIEHTLEGIAVADIDNKTYLTRLIVIEPEQTCAGNCSCNKSKVMDVQEPDLTLQAYIHAKEIIYCDPYTILFYYNTKNEIDYVVSKCMPSDTYSKEIGEELCMYKALQKEVKEKIKKF